MGDGSVGGKRKRKSENAFSRPILCFRYFRLFTVFLDLKGLDFLGVRFFAVLGLVILLLDVVHLVLDAGDAKTECPGLVLLGSVVVDTRGGL